MISSRKGFALTLGASALVLPLLVATPAEAQTRCPHSHHRRYTPPVVITPPVEATDPVAPAPEVTIPVEAPAVPAASTGNLRWASFTLDANQERNARTIVAVVEDRDLPKRAAVIALATAWQESNIRIWANSSVPQSMSVYHEHVGDEATSVGIFQQELGPNRQMGFDDAATVMAPVWSTNAFLDRMIQANSNWASIPLTVAAQDAQDSQHPDRYAQWEDEAASLVSQIG